MLRRDRSGEPCLQIACEGRIQREKGAEEQGRDGGKRRRHGAEVVQADIDPTYAGEKQAQPEGEAERGGAPRRRRPLPQPQQAGGAKDRQRGEGDRRETQDRGGAEEECSQQRGLRMPQYGAIH